MCLVWRFAPREVSVSKKVAQERNFCQMNTCHLVNLAQFLPRRTLMTARLYKLAVCFQQP